MSTPRRAAPASTIALVVTSPDRCPRRARAARAPDRSTGRAGTRRSGGGRRCGAASCELQLRRPRRPRTAQLAHVRRGLEVARRPATGRSTALRQHGAVITRRYRTLLERLVREHPPALPAIAAHARAVVLAADSAPRPRSGVGQRRAVHRSVLPPRPDFLGHERQERREQPQQRRQRHAAWRCSPTRRPRPRVAVAPRA